MPGSTPNTPRGGGLLRCMNAADGIDPRTALLRAAREIETHREEAVSRIQAAVAAIIALAQNGAQSRTEMAVRAIEIAGVSGVYSMMPLGRAASSLSDVLELLGDGGPWVQDWVDVHINAIRALAVDAPRPPEKEEAILMGLRDVLKYATLRRGDSAGARP